MSSKGMINKKFIYGKTGTGKSYTLISPVITEKKEFIYITCNNLKSELKYMGLSEDYLEEIEIDKISSIPNKTGVNLGNFPEAVKKEQLMNVIGKLIAAGTVKQARNTIVFSNIPTELLADTEFMSQIEQWESSVVIECLCDSEKDANKWFPHILQSSEWEKVPVFRKLY